MVSRKKWIVRGNTTHIKKADKGYWLTISGVLKNDSFKTNIKLDCWVPNLLVFNISSMKKRLHASGVLVFEAKDCYFLSEELFAI